MKNFSKHCLTPLLFAVLFASLTLAACSNQETTTANTPSESPTSQPTTITAQADDSNMDNYLPRLTGKAVVEMKVNGSPIAIEVNGDEAPITAGNFVDLVQRGVYNGLVFHRVVKQPQPFVVQGGDPKGNGTGGFIDPQTSKPRYIPLEIKLEEQAKPNYSKALGQQAGLSAPPVVLSHKRGAVAMARSQMPDSASSQFYFALSDLAFLDGDYAVFGYVTNGMDVVDNIKQGDRIESAKVVSGLENLQK